MTQHRIHQPFAFARRMTVVLLLGLAVVTMPAQASAGSLFARSNGSGNTCTQAQPCTLATALTKAVEGDTVYVAGGTYMGSEGQVAYISESITLQGGWDGAATGAVHTDPAAHPSILDGQDARRVVVVAGGSAPTIRDLTITHGHGERGGGIFVERGDPIISGNTITENAADNYGGGIYLYSGDATISGNRITYNNVTHGGGGVMVSSLATARVEGNRIAHNQAEYSGALEVDNGRAWVTGNTMVQNQASSTLVAGGARLQLRAVNNVVADRTGRALDCYGGQVELIHNTIVGQRWGIVLDYGVTVTATNNILAYQTGVSILNNAHESPVLIADHNLFWGNKSDPAVGTHPVFGDPRFFSVGGEDYRIAQGSAALNAGVDAGVTSDIDGHTRPIGAGFDIGAYEGATQVYRAYLPLSRRDATAP